jgi:protoporphyrinogen oxidase
MINRKHHDRNFEALAYQTYGKTLSKQFLINYTEKLWGSPAHTLDANISGNRLKHLDISSLLRQLLFKSKNVNHLDGSFYYPKYGFGTIFEKIIDKIDNNSIQYHSPIKKIFHEDGKIIKVFYGDNKTENVNRVISTLPINILINALEPAPPKQIIDIVNSIQYRNLYLCVLYLDRPYFSDNASIYFPESTYPFTRIYEPKNRSMEMAPKDKTCIVIEIPYDQKMGELSSTPKEKIIEQTSNILINNGLIKKEEIIGNKLMDLQYAYPVLHLGSKAKLDNIFSYLSNLKNLYIIGRNAQFEYTHIHNIFKHASLLIDRIS